jgi:cell fate (sporulation/competence/biofilm development) regulator YmcA (YheA/YmcA/DUF963 family)
LTKLTQKKALEIQERDKNHAKEMAKWTIKRLNKHFKTIFSPV